MSIRSGLSNQSRERSRGFSPLLTVAFRSASRARPGAASDWPADQRGNRALMWRGFGGLPPRIDLQFVAQNLDRAARHLGDRLADRGQPGPDRAGEARYRRTRTPTGRPARRDLAAMRDGDHRRGHVVVRSEDRGRRFGLVEQAHRRVVSRAIGEEALHQHASWALRGRPPPIASRKPLRRWPLADLVRVADDEADRCDARAR